MSFIDVSHLTFSYEGAGAPIFENAGFRLDTDWKLGFIGRNGRGKTTFLKLLMGEYPYGGTISASVPFAYFPYEVPQPERAALAVMESLCPGVMPWELERELSLLEVEESALERPFSRLSNGEQTKFLLAALFLGEDRFPLIDEPTNHLDLHGRAVLSRYLKSRGGFILVSHDRCFLDGCIDHVLSINRAGIEVQRGNYTSWKTNRDRMDAFELAENDRLRKDVRRLEDAARSASRWSDQVEKTKIGSKNSGLRPDRGYIGHKSAKLMQRSKNLEARRQRAAEEASGLLKNVEQADGLKLSPLPYCKEVLLSARELALYYEAPEPMCAGISFELRRGDRAALTGPNGAGKSTLMHLLCGRPIRRTGTLEMGTGLVLSHVPQDASGLSGSFADFIAESRLDQPLFRAILQKLGFPREYFDRPLDRLSAGQKKKLLLARSLCQSAHLYLWDEPLNYIDVLSRAQIEDLLLESRPTILFIEHDRAFCERVATKTIRLGGDA